MRPGKIGRYSILHELGAGGMAVVYLGHDPLFDRPVAVKIIHPHRCTDPLVMERFRREARSIARLEHPAVVPVYDTGQDESLAFLVMRYMQGGSLQRKIAERPFVLDEAAALFRRIAPALDKAHASGVIHRDIKPGNVLFDQEGNPHLSDFGLAKILSSEASITRSEFFGTPSYASPEQCSGDAPTDGRTDVYSLTVMLFRLLTGSLPYEAESPMAVLRKHIEDPIPQLRPHLVNVPAGLQAIIDRGMAKSPSTRFTTAGELSQALDHIVKLTRPAEHKTREDREQPATPRVGDIPPTPAKASSPMPAGRASPRPGIPAPTEKVSLSAPYRKSAVIRGGEDAPIRSGAFRQLRMILLWILGGVLLVAGLSLAYALYPK